MLKIATEKKLLQNYSYLFRINKLSLNKLWICYFFENILLTNPYNNHQMLEPF